MVVSSLCLCLLDCLCHRARRRSLICERVCAARGVPGEDRCNYTVSVKTRGDCRHVAPAGRGPAARAARAAGARDVLTFVIFAYNLHHFIYYFYKLC